MQLATKDFVTRGRFEDAISCYTNSTDSDKPFLIVGHGVPAKAREKLNTYLYRS